MAFLNDTFTDSNGTQLGSHTGELGATWTLHPSYTANALVRTNRIHGNSGTRGYYASGTPASADYDVEGVLRRLSSTGNAGLAGRMDTAANTMYLVTWEAAGGGQFALYKINAGVIAAALGTFADTATDTDRTVKLQMRGTAIKVFVDGVERISVTDSSISAAGRAGVRLLNGTGTTGTHIDSITASDAGSALTKQIDDSISATDAVAKTARKTQADAVAGTDQVSRAWVAARSVADSASVADAQAKAVGRSQADAIAGTDAVGKGVSASVDDAAALSDTQAKDVARQQSDDLAVTDARELALGKAVADTASLSDQATPSLGGGGQDHALEINDAISATDQTERQWDAVRSVADSADVQDAMSKSVTRTEADSLAASDAVARAIGLARSDAASLADALSRTWAIERSLSDAAALSDSLARAWVAERTLADGLSITDAMDAVVAGAPPDWTYGGVDGATFDGVDAFAYAGADGWTYDGVDGFTYNGG